jgi:arylsulfatase A-like enzyme
MSKKPAREAAGGGLVAGATLGCLIGAVDVADLLEAPVISGAPWRALVLLVLSLMAYALVFAVAGAAVGLATSMFARTTPRPRARAPVASAAARTSGVLTGASIFVLAAWRVRAVTPDLSVFRRYCLPETLVGALVALVTGLAVYAVARRLVGAAPVSRWLSSKIWRRLLAGKLMAFAVVLAAVVLLEPIPGGGVGETSGVGPNVILVSIDTLRAGRLGYMGHDRPTSPFIDGLSSRSVVFRQAVCQFPLTSPSQASILTSRYPRSHGSLDNAVPIHDSVRLLPEVLRDHGYHTAAFVTNRICGIRYGFGRGFDYYVEAGGGDLSRSRLRDWLLQLRVFRLWWRLSGGERLTMAAESWLSGNRREPFFLWYHQLAPHSPYAPPLSYELEWDSNASRVVPTTAALGRINRGEVGISSEDLAHIESLYDAEIAFTDDLLRQLFAAIERRGLTGSTLIIFTADHGESLYDRDGYIGHGERLYDEEIIVPLFFLLPGNRAGRVVIERPVETIDIAPTVLDFLGLPPEPAFQGVSLWDEVSPGRRQTPEPDTTVDGSAPPALETRPAFSSHRTGSCVRTNRWKYIEQDGDPGTAELYDLETDPGETANLITAEPAMAHELGALLAAWNAGVPAIRPGDHEVDEESLRLLRSLGYVD